ncbi:MAG: IS1595 family transposase [Azonexus sp.]|jgi:transposase|uniref:IS1595 family transposase n=1 Tax=Azonexus sp. TaxID=1872668 RepID=UPI00281AA481|nr:IS1595 family transposase [Azonexus sp.]MDR0776513.1 IS1595 family transposase [Azonexus sp.]
MYERRSRLSQTKRTKLLEHFVAGTTARAAAELVGVHRNTAATFYTRLRKVIAVEMEKTAAIFGEEVEVDESYFGGACKGRRGRGAAGKVPVFGLLKRGGKVYTVMIPNAQSVTLLPIMERMILPDSIVYTDSFASYDALDVSAFHHVRINHSERFANERNHINGIENFWNQAKRHLRRFNGIPQRSFYLFLKECEWRFNGGNHRDLLNQLKSWTKNYNPNS